MSAPAVAADAPPERVDRFYSVVRAIVRFWIWFFFKSVDVRHGERVPERGPILLTINHPNNLIDSFLVGGVLTRKVHYMTTAALFRNPLLARFLSTCGAISVYRKQDDPDKMDRNLDTFAAVDAALLGGRVVAIYPEGTTHAEARVQRIKTGAARIALGFEARHPGTLTVVSVGLSFEARKSFRGRVLVAFGTPIPIAPYRDAHARDPVRAVEALTTEIQRSMEAQVVHVARIDEGALVRAVEELYRGDLVRALREERGLGEGQIDLVRLSRSIADATSHFKTRDPERVERLWQGIRTYQALLAEYHVRDDAVRAQGERVPARRRLRHGWEAVVGFPFFLYGAVVNFLPYWVPRALARRMARKETDYATVRLLASIVAYPVFWGLETWLVGRLADARWALAFFLSLPLSGLVAYRYLVGAGRLRARLRFNALRLTREHAARRLIAERQAILAELERAKTDYLAATRGSSF